MLPVFEYKHVVVEDEIDELRHVYNVRYLDWLIHAAKGHCLALGWPDERFFRTGGSVGRSNAFPALFPAGAAR